MNQREAVQTISKVEIAKRQLKLAVHIFLAGKSPSSVITLAGASSGILYELVARASKEPFIDYACRVANVVNGHTPPRKHYAHRLQLRLGVIAHKHCSASDTDEVELDLERLAADAITAAIIDYTKVSDSQEPFVQAFFRWRIQQPDGAELMESYKSVPQKLRPQ